MMLVMITTMIMITARLTILWFPDLSQINFVGQAQALWRNSEVKASHLWKARRSQIGGNHPKSPPLQKGFGRKPRGIPGEFLFWDSGESRRRCPQVPLFTSGFLVYQLYNTYQGPLLQNPLKGMTEGYGPKLEALTSNL